jgi:hypothetical protein
MAPRTLTRPPADRRSRPAWIRDPDAMARAVFALICLAFAIGFFVYPTYPNYDSYYSLLWGREVLDFVTPTFEGFRVPTEHPLAIAAGAVLSLFGDGGDRLWVALTFASFLWLVWGVWKLGRIAFTPLVGAVAAALMLTRFDYGFLAARGYVDVPYMALVVWAAVLEARRPRRGDAVLWLLALAGMLRPEAWLLAAGYWCWVSWRASWPQRIRYAAITAVGPLVWFAVDYLVTGDPLFSLLYTSGSAEDLGRSKSLSQLPSSVPFFYSSLLKLPVLIAALLGIVLAGAITPRRMAAPFALFASGLGAFFLIGAAGASVIERYLAVSAVGLMVFAGVALGGFSMLRPGTWPRRAWMLGAVALVVFGVAFTVTRVNLSTLDNELTFRGQAHRALADVLRSPEVKAGLRCGPLTVPNHKLVPDSRWILDLPDDRVLARADDRKAAPPQPAKGVAIVVTGRFALFKHAWTDPSDSPLIEVPPAGFHRVRTSDFYAAYARC